VPHEIDIIVTFTGGLTAALIFGFIAHRLRLSPVVGYLIAGVAVGPFTPGFVAQTGIADQFAEIGVILLMFGVGLHLRIRDLLAGGRVAIAGSVVQMAVVTALGIAVMHAFGWSVGAGVVFGLTLPVASTVVLLRLLTDRNVLKTPAGHLAMGWTLIEDFFTVFVLVVLPFLAGDRPTGGADSLVLSLGLAALKIAALIVFTLVVARPLVPRLLKYFARAGSEELFTLAVLVLALGISVGSARLFGASMALGAFLAGLVVGQTQFGARAASEALPMRDAFAVLFFVSMGMHFDPHELLSNPLLTAATLAVVLIAKPLSVIGVVLLLRQPAKTAVSVALATAQIGEFSFILASLGTHLGLLPVAATQALVATAIVSIGLNPILFRLNGPLTRLLSRRSEARQLAGTAGP
jgi:monovalent cation:H+ antiporter-2, CPA2 family